MTISNQEIFIEHLKKTGIIQDKPNSHGIEVFEATLNGFKFSWFPMFNIKFRDCRFLNCHFDDFQFNGIEMNTCSFQNCTFQNTIFMDCSLSDCIFDSPFSNTLYFGMTYLENITFNKVEFQFTSFSDCHLQRVIFNDGWFHIGKFETGDFTCMFKSRIFFNNISLSNATFSDLDLTESVFQNSGTGSNFINCKLSPDTFIKNHTEGVSSIDLSTLLQSEDLSEDVLRKIFSITNKNVKEIVKHLTTEPIYYSVFISYSFKDKYIGEELKRLLSKNGIKTFFWELDAPAGQRVKKIMKDNIRDYDKFLFVASENSLKSEACHFEISEAREKYYKSWSDIFVPIHIDDYLFKVNKEDLPSKLVGSYWENIKELKEVNSLDFTFIGNKEVLESNNQFSRLLNALKISKVT